MRASHVIRIEANGFTCSCGYEELSDHPTLEAVVQGRTAQHSSDVQNPSPGHAHRSIRLPGAGGATDMSRIGAAMELIGHVRCFIHYQTAHVGAASGNEIGVRACCNTLLNQLEQALQKASAG